MQIVDPVILDPADFLPGGAELDLSGAGFRVLDANFGEADVELELQRQAIGEVPTTYHPPNTTTVLALGVREEGDVDLPTAAHQLAQKVGEINSPGTEHWLKREFEVGGNFAGALGKRVYKATLSGLGSWQRGESPDVVLTLVTGPYWYADLEVESEVFESEAGVRELIFELADVLGTSPGLIRIRVTNDGEEDWRGLILAGECRDHPQDETADTTAALAYAAADLTLKGGSEVQEVEGLEVVEHDELSAGWLSILNSEIDGVGHMTHRGVRRPWVRAEDPGEVPEDVQLRLRWRALGSSKWSENRIVPLNIVGDYQLYDLGECRPEPAALGDQRWEWDLQARAVSGAGKVRLHRVVPAPTEQYMVLKAPHVAITADAQSAKSPATGAADASEGGGSIAWSNPTHILTSNNLSATATLEKEEGYAYTQWLKATNFGFAIPSEGTVTGVVVEVERVSSAAGKGGEVRDSDLKLVKAGSIQGSSGESGNIWVTGEKYRIYGAADDLWGLTLTPTEVNDPSFGVAFKALLYTGSESLTASIDHIRITVYYSPESDSNSVCYVERSTEFRSDGVFRKHPEDNVWGEVIPEGFLPVAIPSGLEGRTLRYIVIPTQGDLGELADSGDNALRAQTLVRPGYLYSREAA